MKLLPYLAALLVPFSALATTIPTLQISELFAKADVVAIVEIVEGRALGTGQESCGAIYTGQIERALKGTVSQTIEFGHYSGYPIGGRYLLFLTKPGVRFDPLNSTNSNAMAREKAFRDRCEAKQTAHRVMHSGAGAIVIHMRGQDESGRLELGRFVAVPSSVPRTKVSTDNGPGGITLSVWIAEADAVRYLETLMPKSSSANPAPSEPADGNRP